MNDATPTQLVWTKALRSYGIGECVELADSGDAVLMRDSKDPDGPQLRFTRREIAAFIDAAGRGEFNHLIHEA